MWEGQVSAGVVMRAGQEAVKLRRGRRCELTRCVATVKPLCERTVRSAAAPRGGCYVGRERRVCIE